MKKTTVHLNDGKDEKVETEETSVWEQLPVPVAWIVIFYMICEAIKAVWGKQ